MLKFILDLLPSNKVKQRKLALDYFMLLLEHRAVLESSGRDIDKAVRLFAIELKKRKIYADPNWRPEKFDFHGMMYG